MNRIIAGIVLIVAASLVGTYAASVAKPICGATTSSKEINLVMPTNPPRDCAYHIKNYSKYVCQLLIQFQMVLSQPTVESVNGNTYAECTHDYFDVNGLRLCGTETWQHIYVPFNATAGETVVDLLIVLANRAGNTGLPNPSWDMTVTQLECPAGASVRSLEHVESSDEHTLLEPETFASTIKDGFLVAPPGCLQYFPQKSGVVKSFNYNDGRGIYPSKMNYAICFRRTTATTELSMRSYFFHVGNEASASTLMTDTSCYNSDRSSDQAGDYLMVPQGLLVDSNRPATYFCGATNGDVVISSNNPGPLIVLFNSDEVTRQTSEGFAFTYTVK